MIYDAACSVNLYLPFTKRLRVFQKAHVLLELAAGLVPSLDDEAISLLYRTAKPLVRDDATPQLQKRAYKVHRER